MEKKVLDLILVPCGILALVAYHLWLLYRIAKHPTKTVIGVNAINRRLWVQAMMEDVSKNGILAVQSLRNTIMASTLLASTAIMLDCLIAVLMSRANRDQASLSVVYGDNNELVLSTKFLSILVCFTLAFLLNVQSIRYYNHASILINVPFKKYYQNQSHRMLTAEFVATAVNRGSYFWSLGLRAFYFSFPLFLWLFGPIPMFLSCLLLVATLYILDVTFDCGTAGFAGSKGVEQLVDVELGRRN